MRSGSNASSDSRVTPRLVRPPGIDLSRNAAPCPACQAGARPGRSERHRPSEGDHLRGHGRWRLGPPLGAHDSSVRPAIGASHPTIHSGRRRRSVSGSPNVRQPGPLSTPLRRSSEHERRVRPYVRSLASPRSTSVGEADGPPVRLVDPALAGSQCAGTSSHCPPLEAQNFQSSLGGPLVGANERRRDRTHRWFRRRADRSQFGTCSEQGRQIGPVSTAAITPPWPDEPLVGATIPAPIGSAIVAT